MKLIHFIAIFQFILLFLLASSSLSVHTRYVKNRFTRADEPSKTTETPANDLPNDIAFWLRNLVVGPPVGAPHITLHVNSKIDDDPIGNFPLFAEPIEDSKPKSAGSTSRSSDDKTAKIETSIDGGSDSKAKKPDKPKSTELKEKAKPKSDDSKKSKKPIDSGISTTSAPKPKDKSDKEAPTKKPDTVKESGYEFSFR